MEIKETEKEVERNTQIHENYTLRFPVGRERFNG